MQQNFNGISYLCGNDEILSDIVNVPVLGMFSDKMKNLLYSISSHILKDPRTRHYPDVTSYAFWIRKAYIEREQLKFHNAQTRLGRGVAFHIAPSNVPVTFAVSMTNALLAGNPCIIRVSNKNFEQVNIICDAINKVFEIMPEMKNYICIIRYQHSREITQTLSSMCDIRIIWGGNATINEIRQAVLPPRAIELTFADRHSLAIIDADEYLNSDYKKIADNFYTDTYWTDQNACSSPRIVVWTGEKIEKAKEIFWETLEDKVEKEYDFKPISAVNKLNSFCLYSASHENTKLIKNTNKLFRIQTNSLTPDLPDFKESCGLFYEYDTQNLDDIVPLLTKPCQTIAYLGVNPQKIKDVVLKYGTKGVDRIVEIGKTMELSYFWDGYNMVEAMTRILFTE